MSKTFAALSIAAVLFVGSNAKANDDGLPPGFHDFEPLNANLRLPINSSKVGVVCLQWRKALSVAQRVLDGYDESYARFEVNTLNQQFVCGRIYETTLVPVESALRGDSYGRPIVIVKYVLTGGAIVYKAAPLTQE